MTREEIKKLVFDQFQKNYGYDLNNVDGDAPLANLQELDEKLDSMEIIIFISELEDVLKTNIVSSEEQPTTINELIDYLYKITDH